MRCDSGHTGRCAAGKEGAVGPSDYLNTRFDSNTLVPKARLIVQGRQGQVRFWKHIWEGMEESPAGRQGSPTQEPGVEGTLAARFQSREKGWSLLPLLEREDDAG